MRKLFAVAALLAAQIGAQAPPATKDGQPPAQPPAQAQGQPPAQPPLQPQAQPQGEIPVFRSTTQLVQVNVIVRHHGEPVTDLKKEDFRLYDNGKLQAISSFSVESSNGKLPTGAVKLPPNVYTNKLVQKAGVPQSVTVILLDTYNTHIQDQMFARQQVVKFLQTIRPEDRVALYVLYGNGLKVLHDYTTDSTDLLRALNAFSDGKTLPDLSQDQRMSFGTDMIGLNNWMMSGSSGPERDFYMTQRIVGTLQVIEFIANHLASLPGRKNLIWVSGGFPMQIGFNSLAEMRDPSREQRLFGDEVTRTVKAVNNANVAIYPVDARGLIPDHSFDASNQKINTRPKLSGPPGYQNQSTMDELASRTGGKAFYNTNDLKTAIRDAISDAATTYTLGFYPTDEKYDGKFHKFTVKVEHAGIGYDVRYRKGYFDLEKKATDDKTRKAEISDAVMSPLDASALGMAMETRRVDKPAPNSMEMLLVVDPRGIGFEKKTIAGKDVMAGKIDIFFVQKNDRGNQFNGVEKTITLNLTEDKYRAVMAQGLQYHDIVPLVPQATQLRIVARDDASGTIGSLTVPLKTGDPNHGLIRR